jgi:NAD(P)-dependent dehydrogenase (short-subunit alcohol dehydrogenase family)
MPVAGGGARTNDDQRSADRGSNRARHPASLQRGGPGRPGDIADVKTAERAISDGVARFGRIDTLVNNAGIFIAKPFTEYTEADYAAILGVNLTGFFHITQRAVVEMEKRQSGHIVQITTTLVDSANSQVQSRKVDRKPCTAPSCRAAVCHGVLSHPSGDSSRTFMPTAVNASDN